MLHSRSKFGDSFLATLLGITPFRASSSVTVDYHNKSTDSQNQIIFAGLSGQPPKYIENGPERGPGWLEYHTHEIRKGLKEDGFNVKQDWMTPARIAHEFRIQSPICIYPAE